MRLSDLAEKYILFNIYNDETARAIRLACDLFDRRSHLRSIDQISASHIRQFRENTMRVANAVTFNGYLAYIKLVCQWGEKEGKMDASLIRLLRRSPAPKITFTNKTIAPDEYKCVMLKLRNAELVPCAWFWLIVLRFIYGIGLRRRQIVELRIGDIDWEHEVLLLRYQGSKTLNEWKVPIIDAVQTELRYLISAIEQALCRPVRPEDRLFNICYFNSKCTPDPKDPTKMRARYITDIMKSISNKTGIRIGAHRLRHTMATDLCNPVNPDDAPDIFFAQHVLGHSDIRTTKGYVETRMAGRKEYMERLLVSSKVGTTLSGG